MVEALPIARRDAEHLVNRIIEVTAHPGRANARLLGLKIEHLAHESGLPEEISVEARELSGIDLAIQLATLLEKRKVLLMSGNNSTSHLLKEAQKKGHGFDVLAKPVHPSVILDRLKTLQG